MTLEAHEENLDPDFTLPETLFSPRDVLFSLEFGDSMAFDLAHVRSLTNLSIGDLSQGFTRFALGVDRLSQDPETAVYSDAAGFLEIVRLDSDENRNDVNWQTDGETKSDDTYTMELQLAPEWGNIVMERANELQISGEELLLWMHRMGIRYFRDTEEYHRNYFVKIDGEYRMLGFGIFLPDEEEE